MMRFDTKLCVLHFGAKKNFRILNRAYNRILHFQTLIFFNVNTFRMYQIVYESTFLQVEYRKRYKIYALVHFFKGMGLIFESPYIRKFTVICFKVLQVLYM